MGRKLESTHSTYSTGILKFTSNSVFKVLGAKMETKNGHGVYRVLFDSGSSHSIISRAIGEKSRTKSTGKSIIWNTPGASSNLIRLEPYIFVYLNLVLEKLFSGTLMYSQKTRQAYMI